MAKNSGLQGGYSSFLTQLHKLRSQLRGSFFVWFHFRSSYVGFNSHNWHSYKSRIYSVNEIIFQRSQNPSLIKRCNRFCCLTWLMEMKKRCEIAKKPCLVLKVLLKKNAALSHSFWNKKILKTGTLGITCQRWSSRVSWRSKVLFFYPFQGRRRDFSRGIHNFFNPLPFPSPPLPLLKPQIWGDVTFDT